MSLAARPHVFPQAKPMAPRVPSSLPEDLTDASPTNEARHASRLKDAPPHEQALYRRALADVESNVVRVEGRLYFGAGRSFGPLVYERDIAYSGVLGLNTLYPRLMHDSLVYARDVRTQLGLKVSEPCTLEPLGIPCTVLPISELEYMRRHRTNSFTRRTDDVVWLWSMHDLLCRHDTEDAPARWRWMYETGVHYFEHFYAPFHDDRDGLFRGQASFIDAHYADDDKATGYDLSWSLHDCLRIKALSTNCLYVRAMDALADAAGRLNMPEAQASWSRRASDLRSAIRRGLRRPDGTLAYFKHADDSLEPRSEALGTALAVLFDVVQGDEARRALQAHPVTEDGVPLIHPPLPHEAFYHNHSAWPFVDAFYLRAIRHATGQGDPRAAMRLIERSCTAHASFYELIDYRTGTPAGSPRQLWTAAAYLGFALEAFEVLHPYAEHNVAAIGSGEVPLVLSRFDS